MDKEEPMANLLKINFHKNKIKLKDNYQTRLTKINMKKWTFLKG